MAKKLTSQQAATQYGTARISLQEAAARYGLSDRTLRRYLAEGRISAHRIGPRVLRFDPAELEAQLTGACVNCSGATANIEEDT